MGAELMGKDRRCLSCNSNKQQTAQLPGVSGAGPGQERGGSAGAVPARSPRLGGFGGAVPGPFPWLLPPRAPPGGPARTQRGSSAAGREEREGESHRFRARHTTCPLAHTSGTQTHGIQLQIKVTKFKRTASSSVV